MGIFEELDQRKDEFLLLVHRLEEVIRHIPYKEWHNSPYLREQCPEIIVAARSIQEFFHQFDSGVHITIKRSSNGDVDIRFVCYPLKKVTQGPRDLFSDPAFQKFLKEVGIALSSP